MGKNNRGSMTVEASLIIPILLSVFLAFLYFFQILVIQERVGTGLCQTAQVISQYGYLLAKEPADGDDTVEPEKETQRDSLVSQYVKGLLTGKYMENYISDDFLDATAVYGGRHGVVYRTSVQADQDGSIYLRADYMVSMPLFSFVAPKFKFGQQVSSRVFYGTEEIGCVENEDDAWVYITPNSEKSKVYHTSETCTHLQLQVEAIAYEQISGRRTSGGGRFTACEKCMRGRSSGRGQTMYITKEGTCYHCSVECSGLKRNVRKVKLSTLEGYHVCKKCGG